MKKIMARGGPNFPFVVVWIALVAGLSSGLCAALGIQAWLMFLGWSTYVTGNGSVKAGASAVACALIGVPMGMAGAILLGSLAPLGPLALILTVFILAGLAMLSTLTPPFNSPVGYFLGLLGFFGSAMKPEASNIIPLAAPILIGGLSGCFASLVAARIAAWNSRPA